MNDNNEMLQKNEIKETKSIWVEAFDWIDCIVITVLIILVGFTFLFKQVQVDGTSMEDTLTHKERVILSDVFYKPQYGDIVVVSNEVYG